MSRLLRILMIFLALVVALFGWRYLMFPKLIVEQGWEHHLITHPIAIYFHFACGPMALLAGCIQFLKQVRIKAPAIHRFIGKVYVASVCLAAISALPLALTTKSGPVASSGLLVLAIIWFGVTVYAAWLAINGNIDSHRKWMMRSYALTYAGVNLRLLLAVATGFLDMDYESTYPVIVWLSWLFPLVAIEVYIFEMSYGIWRARFKYR